MQKATPDRTNASRLRYEAERRDIEMRYRANIQKIEASRARAAILADGITKDSLARAAILEAERRNIETRYIANSQKIEASRARDEIMKAEIEDSLTRAAIMEANLRDVLYRTDPARKAELREAKRREAELRKEQRKAQIDADIQLVLASTEICGFCHDPLSEKTVVLIHQTESGAPHLWHMGCLLGWNEAIGGGDTQQCPICKDEYDVNAIVPIQPPNARPDSVDPEEEEARGCVVS